MDSSILEIIPKITSPLAVISFISYIVFLIKQSHDRKKEKALNASDPKAQKIAVESIVRDYPDVRMGRVTDARAKAALANKIIENKLKAYQKTLNFSLAFTIIFAMTYIASLIIEKTQHLKEAVENSDSLLTEKTERLRRAIKNVDGSWSVKKSLENGKDYALLNVTLHIRVEDVKNGKELLRRALFRTHYSLKALHDIKQDDKIFGEEYYSNVVKVEQWPGSEKEVPNVVGGLYYVKFEAKENDVKTLTTGANYFYPLPLAKSSKACFGVVSLKDNEWVWCYPNYVDFIDNLTIIVEAQNIQLDIPEDATFRSGKDSKLLIGNGICYKKNSDCTTLVAKWQNISPDECLGFKISWSLPVIH